MSKPLLRSRSFKDGFARGFISIVQMNGKNPYRRTFDAEQGSVKTAWRDVGLAIEHSIGKARNENGIKSKKHGKLEETG